MDLAIKNELMREEQLKKMVLGLEKQQMHTQQKEKRD
jgi:hypothetical protein